MKFPTNDTYYCEQNSCDQNNIGLNLIDVVFTISINGQQHKVFMTISIDNDMNDDDDDNALYVFLLKIFQYLSEIQLFYLYSINMSYVNEYNTPEFVRNRNGYFHFNPISDHSLLAQYQSTRSAQSTQKIEESIKIH